jgi:hypothetical protein
VKEAFGLLGKRIRSCHINELTNDYPWQEFFGLLKASGYNRWTLCEVAESKEPARFLRFYRALWEQMTA